MITHFCFCVYLIPAPSPYLLSDTYRMRSFSLLTPLTLHLNSLSAHGVSCLSALSTLSLAIHPASRN